jgi:hypothetical protein
LKVAIKHVFRVVGLGMAAVFAAMFFTTRVSTQDLGVVAPRVGMARRALDALGSKISSQTGATIGTSRRVVYLLACSGVTTAATIESKSIEAAQITETERLTAREAASTVLARSGTLGAQSLLRDC